jgi:hypothetical protein
MPPDLLCKRRRLNQKCRCDWETPALFQQRRWNSKRHSEERRLIQLLSIPGDPSIELNLERHLHERGHL